MLNQIDAIAAAGFDTAELHIWEIMSLDEAAYQAARRRVHDCAIPCEVFNNPLPMDISIAAAEFDCAFYNEHMKRAVDRISHLGGRMINFGNGRARSIPPGADRDACTEKILTVIGTLCELAAEANMVVLLEPIGRAIINFVRTLDEAAAVAGRLEKANLKTLIDLRWFVDAPGHAWSDVARHAPFIAHAHIDYPLSTLPERVEATAEDGYDYAPFFSALAKAGYEGIVATETNSHIDFATDLDKGMALYRRYLP